MAGWIKLWRKMIENGHFKMPGHAFKLWIYCLLEAVPYPDHKRSLATGELQLSYQSISENLGESNKKLSMSTISAALKYLELNGYITLQSEKFKGIKAKVVNWTEYQALVYSSDEFPTTHTVAETNSPTNLTLADTCSPAAPSGVETGCPTTLTVVDPDSSTTLTVVDDYSQSSRPTTPTVAVRAAEPYSRKASSAAKNTIKNTYKNNIVVVVVAADFETEFGRPLSPIELKQLASWQKTYSDDLIKEALVQASLQDKRSIAYIGGILKNWSRAGITTVEDIRQKQRAPSPQGGKRNAKSKPGYRPNEVDWTKEPDTL